MEREKELERYREQLPLNAAVRQMTKPKRAPLAAAFRLLPIVRRRREIGANGCVRRTVKWRQRASANE